MSHVTKVKPEVRHTKDGMIMPITDINILALAAMDLGMTLNEKSKTFKSYYNDKQPVDAEIALNNGMSNTYSVGVKKEQDGTIALLFDSYMGGGGLIAAIGTNGQKLVQRYQAQTSHARVRKLGFRTSESLDERGRVVIFAVA